MFQKFNMHIATINSLEFFSLVPEENYDYMLKKAEETLILYQLIGCNLPIVVSSKNTYNLGLEDTKDKTIKRLQRISGKSNLATEASASSA